MHPWKESLSRLTSWAQNNNLQFDALGLVTFLGAEEVNASVGRLVQSSWVEFLPLLGAFVIAGDRFTGKQPGYKMYNITASMMTTELAGWFSRWMKAQDFEQTRSIVTWTMHQRPTRVTQFWIPSLTVGLALNGTLTVLTILSGDWFGLTSVVSMVVSVIVRYILVQQNCAGINRRIGAAKAKWKRGAEQPSEAIVILDDSKAVTVRAPACLMGGVFTQNPDIPNPRLYAFARWVGWLAFAAHILTLGSAALHTQIVTVVVIITATILNCYKFGCDDSKIWASLTNSHTTGDGFSRTCWVSSQLEATVSVYPEKWSRWPEPCQNVEPDSQMSGGEKRVASETETEDVQPVLVDKGRQRFGKRLLPSLCRHERSARDEELNMPHSVMRGFFKSEGRQDLYVWLRLTDAQWKLLDWWDLVPRGQAWKAEYERKKAYFLAKTSCKKEELD
ncbi:hypothetical protein B0T10DRAFT_495667 [Thelonectria olida]|uniref:Uncharacterized protein n=1 Tax=Thelonectria olida TaxID=1576542 RepID=A0A9P8VVH1_9HYPO|nr:hypothetical protein B0T10DRAFT_495667 [Thelonectria olida]